MKKSEIKNEKSSFHFCYYYYSSEEFGLQYSKEYDSLIDCLVHAERFIFTSTKDIMQLQIYREKEYLFDLVRFNDRDGSSTFRG